MVSLKFNIILPGKRIFRYLFLFPPKNQKLKIKYFQLFIVPRAGIEPAWK